MYPRSGIWKRLRQVLQCTQYPPETIRKMGEELTTQHNLLRAIDVGGSTRPTYAVFVIASVITAERNDNLAKVCRTKQRENASRSSRTITRPRTNRSRRGNQATHHVDEAVPQPEYVDQIYHIPEQRALLLVANVLLNQVELGMEVETGASASIISEKTYDRLWPRERPRLTPSARKLRTYTGEELIPSKGTSKSTLPTGISTKPYHWWSLLGMVQA